MKISVIVDPANATEVEGAMKFLATFIGAQASAIPEPTLEPDENLNGVDDMFGGTDDSNTTEVDDMFGGMEFDSEPELEPELPTIETIKEVLNRLVKAKGRDVATKLGKDIIGKLKVKNLEGIPQDKIPAVIGILEKAIG